MGFFNGILNYTITFSILIVCIIFLRSYKKSLKINLSQSVSSFFSIILCIFFIFKIDNLYFLFELAGSYNLTTYFYIFLIIILFIFTHVIVKFIIKKLMKYTHVIELLKKDDLVSKSASFIVVLMRKSIFMLYLIIILTISYNQLYFSGVTKPIASTPIIKTSQIDILADILKIEEASYNTSTFTDLFYKDKVKTDILLIKDLLAEFETYEAQFNNDIYPNLSQSTKDKIIEKSVNKGILTVLIEDDYYVEIFNIKADNFFKNNLIKIPYINKFLYKEEIETSKFINYIKTNSELILWLDESKAKINTYNENDLIILFKEDYSEIKDIKDKDNSNILRKMDSSIESYYLIKAFSETVIADNLSTDDVETFINNGNNLDIMIKAFNKAYKEGDFLKFKTEFKDAFQLTERYLSDYDDYSKSIKVNINPKARITAAALHKDVKLSKYLYNERLLNKLLLYIYEQKTFELMDTLLWGYFTETSNDETRLSSEKLTELFIAIDEMSGLNKESIDKEIVKLNDKILPYIKEQYAGGTLSYDMLKVWYKQDKYGSDKFTKEIQDLIK